MEILKILQQKLPRNILGFQRREYIALILCLVFFIGGGILGWQQGWFKEKATVKEKGTILEELRDWNTYSNPKANLTFKYPTDWEIKEESQAGGALRVVLGRKGDSNRNNFVTYDSLKRFDCSQDKTCVRNFQISTLDPGILDILVKIAKSEKVLTESRSLD